MYHDLQKFGRVKINEPLSKHTTFKIGGHADFFVSVESSDSVTGILRFLDGQGASYAILGSGSNTLARDEGFRGVVIHIKNPKSEIKDDTIVADAGCITADISRLSLQAGLAGFEWGIGVPGTIGGAVRGNAGAMGGEMKDVVVSIAAYRSGEAVSFSHEECHFGYRDSIFKHSPDVILHATLQLRKGDGSIALKQALAHLQYRAKTQPSGYSSIGCIFKNVELRMLDRGSLKSDIPEEILKTGKIPAGWLVDKAGLKGKKKGNAQISEKHGNFIVNLGGATARDVIALIEEAETLVYDVFGIELEKEIHIL